MNFLTLQPRVWPFSVERDTFSWPCPLQKQRGKFSSDANYLLNSSTRYMKPWSPACLSLSSQRDEDAEDDDERLLSETDRVPLFLSSSISFYPTKRKKSSSNAPLSSSLAGNKTSLNTQQLHTFPSTRLWFWRHFTVNLDIKERCWVLERHQLAWQALPLASVWELTHSSWTPWHW